MTSFSDGVRGHGDGSYDDTPRQARGNDVRCSHWRYPWMSGVVSRGPGTHIVWRQRFVHAPRGQLFHRAFLREVSPLPQPVNNGENPSYTVII